MKPILPILILSLTIPLTSCTIMGKYSESLKYTPPTTTAAPTPIPTPKTFTINAVGDIMLSRAVEKKINGDYTKPFSETAAELKSADITFGNLETPISIRGEKIIGKGIWFRSKPDSVKGLTYAGFDVLSLANNHTLDYSEPALLDTLDMLGNGGIKYFGAGANLSSSRQPVIIEVNGIKIAFIGYSDLYQYNYGFTGKTRTLEATPDQPGISPLKLANIKKDIAALRPQVDLIAVSLHWGTEDTHIVKPARRQFAHDIIDAGADLILGHHPHQLQGVELYNGKPILYSMGNFIFDQHFSDNDDSAIFNLKFKDKTLNTLEITPVIIKDYSVATYAKGQDSTRILGYMEKLCTNLDTPTSIVNGKLTIKTQQ